MADAYTAADLAALDEKLKTAGAGAISVTLPSGVSITRRTLKEMLEFRAWVATQVRTASGKPSTSFLVGTARHKGL